MRQTRSGSPRRASGRRCASCQAGAWVWARVPKPAVLPAAVRHDGDEPPTVAGDVTHGLFRAELAVGDTEEVRMAHQGAWLVPGGDVGHVVGGVAVGHPIGDGHRPVGRDGEDEKQLRKVGAEVLVVTMADGRGRLASPQAPVGVGVAAGHRDGGRVVVKLSEPDAELADRRQHAS